MRITTLWGLRAGFEQDLPELMVAWDTYSIDNHYEGFEKECQEAKASWGNDLVAWRLIEYVVDERTLQQAFLPPVVEFESTEVMDGG